MHEALRLFLPLPEFLKKLFADAWLLKGLAGILAAILDYTIPMASRDIAYTAAVLILLDTATGVWAGIVSGKQITSARFSRVLTKFFGYGAVVYVCSAATKTLAGTGQLQSTAISGVLGFVVLTEGISILENVGKMGVKAPPFLKQWLKARLKDQVEIDK
ncbi:MAG: hypothetical protein BGO01_20655 [Armatimonadetes bacterium 55-13]|nr:phage holin family protein [Armatimonadota bacterium]OJU64523.1 MAG: hypothetical protein BGO01_20655 [Armatimonadetes bacterium 55-13]